MTTLEPLPSDARLAERYMAKDKKPGAKPRGRPPADKATDSLSFRAGPEITAALDALASKNRRSRAMEILLAVEAYLTANGYAHAVASQAEE